jgi:glycosyltransferase involved in cell wall biosynthesis
MGATLREPPGASKAILPPVTPVSAVLITLNEAQRLPAALESVSFCDDIVVVDAGSTDGTVEIARASGARVVVNVPWPGFVAQRNLAAAQARHDWVLALDADERITAPLRMEITALAEAGFDCAGYRMPRLAFYLGRGVRRTDWYPDPQLRLFDRRRGRWQGRLVHESVRVEGAVGRLRGEIEHHPYADIADHVRRIDRYTSLWAEQAQAEGRHAGWVQLLGAPLWTFLRNYVLKGGVLIGEVGLIVSALGAYYTFLKLAKLRERTARERLRP